MFLMWKVYCSQVCCINFAYHSNDGQYDSNMHSGKMSEGHIRFESKSSCYMCFSSNKSHFYTIMVFRAARHGLKLSGKMRRLLDQEEAGTSTLTICSSSSDFSVNKVKKHKHKLNQF